MQAKELALGETSVNSCVSYGVLKSEWLTVLSLEASLNGLFLVDTCIGQEGFGQDATGRGSACSTW